ncbi:hypothetical protein VTH06DRAFT_500 [Thermothelomyces fergusii]
MGRGKGLDCARELVVVVRWELKMLGMVLFSLFKVFLFSLFNPLLYTIPPSPSPSPWRRWHLLACLSYMRNSWTMSTPNPPSSAVGCNTPLNQDSNRFHC